MTPKLVFIDLCYQMLAGLARQMNRKYAVTSITLRVLRGGPDLAIFHAKFEEIKALLET
jgi:hypothetical protein